MAYQGVTLKNTRPSDDLTFVLNADIKQDHVGLAVTQDATAPNTVKLAGAGDAIFGRLENYEDRTKTEGVVVGRVKIIGGMAFKKGTDDSIAVGDAIIGAAGGLVTKISSTQSSDLKVWQVSGDEVIVVKTH